MLFKPSNITYTYNNSGHRNENGKVNYTYDNTGYRNNDAKVNHVADNKMPQQMAFYGVACCLNRRKIVIHLWHVRQSTNLLQT